MNRYYVYGLLHPITKQPFYIGKGTGNRAESHLLLKKDDVYNKRKRNLIEDLQKQNLDIEIVYYDMFLTNQEANDMEIRLIRKYGRKDYDKGGILTNMTKGGEGGDNSAFFTEESFKKMSRPGVSNPRAKLTEEQVIEIYHSTLAVTELSEKYDLSTSQIRGIKKKSYYSDITNDIKVLPGISKSKCPRQILPYDIVREIYLTEETYSFFNEKYNVSPGVVKRIKERKSNKTATKNLGPAGHVKKYKLSNDDVAEIRQSNLSTKDLSKKFNVTEETIRNIILGKTRKFFSNEY